MWKVAPPFSFLCLREDERDGALPYRDTLKNNANTLTRSFSPCKKKRVGRSHLRSTVRLCRLVHYSLVWPHVVAVPWVVVRVGRGVVWNYRIPRIPVRDLYLHSFHRGIHLLQSTLYSYLCLTEAKGMSTPVPIMISSKSRNLANQVRSLHENGSPRLTASPLRFQTYNDSSE